MGRDGAAHDRRLDRRGFLRRVAGAAGCLAALPLLAGPAGCDRERRAAAPELRLSLADLPVGGRLEAFCGDVPVEVRRPAAGEFEARSLLCTHRGCRVIWEPAAGRYRCPCHDGIYDADGRPLAGPPPRPLRQVDCRRDGEALIVGPVES